MFRTLGLRHLCVINRHNEILGKKPSAIIFTTIFTYLNIRWQPYVGIVTRRDLVTAHSLDKCDSDDHSLPLEGGQKLITTTAKSDTGRELREKNYSHNYTTDDFIYNGVTFDKTYSENDLSLMSTELSSMSNSGHFAVDQAANHDCSKLGLVLKKKKKRKKAEFLEHTIDLEKEMAL